MVSMSEKHGVGRFTELPIREHKGEYLASFVDGTTEEMRVRHEYREALPNWV